MFVAILVVSQLCCFFANGATVNASFSPFAGLFSNALNETVSNVLGYTALEEYYLSLKKNETSSSGNEKLNELADDISKKITNLKRVVLQIKDVAEDSLIFENNMTECCEINASKLEMNPKFNQPTGDDACIRISKLSREQYGYLSEDFVTSASENLMEQPSVTWQYFASESGITTMYPAVAIEDCGDYDARYRPWYVQTNVPDPKDVVIIIDIGLSMSEEYNGTSLLEIAKRAAKTLVKTLNPHDRVSVLAFSDRILAMESESNPCYGTTLAKATAENMKKLNNFIDNLTAEVESHFTIALDRAFEYFEQNKPTDDRERVILFFSAGLPTDVETVEDSGIDIFSTLMARNSMFNNTVIVMTYGFGDGNFTMLEKLAEQDGTIYYVPQEAGFKHAGTFTQITDTTDLREEMSSYYHFFSERKTLIDDAEPIWSLPYVDAWGAGLLLTVSLPIRDSQGELGGVVGVDVRFDELFSDAVYFSYQPEKAYVFVIDSQGYVLYHPYFQYPTDGEVKFVDISAYEPDKNMKRAIEKMKAGYVGAASEKKSADGDVKNIFFKQIPNSKFSICLVVMNKVETIKPTEMERPVRNESQYHRFDLIPATNACQMTKLYSSQDPAFFISPRAYADPDAYLREPETVEGIEELRENIDYGSASLLKDGVLLSLLWSRHVETLWQSTDENFDKFVLWRYLATADGVIRTYPGVSLSKNYDPSLWPWYQTAVSEKENFAITREFKNPITGETAVTLSKALFEGDHVIGVLAVDLLRGYLRKVIVESYPECEDSSENICTLIDSTGKVLYDNDKDSLSKHITEVEPLIAEKLFTEKIMIGTECMVMEEAKLEKSFKINRELPFSGKVGGDCFTFYFYPIPKTNAYMITRPATATCEHTGCKCGETCTLDDDECECPCSTSYDGYNMCSNTFNIDPQDGAPFPKPCFPGPGPQIVNQVWNVDGLPECKDLEIETTTTTTTTTSTTTTTTTDKVTATQDGEREQEEEEGEDTRDINAIIAGSIVGGICFIILVIVVALLIARKKRGNT